MRHSVNMSGDAGKRREFASSEMIRRKAKRDANHNEIVAFLRSQGVYVTDLATAGRVPDVLLSYRGANRWAEIKANRQTQYQAMQLRYISETPMDVAFIETSEAAIAYAKHGAGALTQKQKDRLAALLLRHPHKMAFTVTQVRTAIEGEGNA